MLKFVGKVDGSGKKEFEGNVSYFINSLQTKENGALSIIEIKTKELYDICEEIEIDIAVSCYKDKIFYKQI